MSDETPRLSDIFANPDIDNYIVQYQGDIKADLAKQKDYYVTVINDRYAIVSVPKNVEINSAGGPYFSTIVYVKPVEIYTLQDISPVEASQSSFLQLNLPLNLTGKGVNVAILDTGIDYLNEEFIKPNGETRIQVIWDQTINPISPKNGISIPFGTIYTKQEIQNAINAYKKGDSPYDIVPSQDTIGHGTNMAGIIGARGKDPKLKGVAPDCDFVVVKLIRDSSFEKQFGIKIPCYNITNVFAALEFLYRFALIDYKPMVIYFPLGTNFGNHKGGGLTEQFIETICRTSGLTFITGTGNEKETRTHTSGIISEVGGNSVIEIDVSPEQKDLFMEIWVDTPNIMYIDVISPSGESSGGIYALMNNAEVYTFIFEKTLIKVNFYLPEELTGDELIRIRFYGIQPGIWKVRLTGTYILDGKYNAWLPQKGITVGGTHFSSSIPYGTITNPSNSNYLISIAAYNQNNNNLVNYSGMAFEDNYVGFIDVAAGGVNALTVAPNNETAVVNGTCVAAAVAAGACAMLFQWGIIDGNDPYMYSQTLKTYLQRGTIKRMGDTYPNAQWGYGMLNIYVMFQNMT